MINYLITPLFLLLLIFYLRFLYGLYKGLNNLQQVNIKEIKEKISVIIPFRNESGTILNSLRSLEEQDYPQNKFEIIYVNDSSTDDSYNKICSEKRNKNIKVINVPEDFSENAHKKRAIRYGIENASGDIIVTTDADCTHSKDWLKTIISCFTDETGFVSGPVEFINDNSLFGRIQKLEFLSLIITGAGLIGSNRPIICNAANLAFRKEAFLRVNGYRDNMNLSSGDDEFLMQKIWRETNYKIKFCINKDAITQTPSNKTFREFYMQRKRWASKGLFYSDKYLIIKLLLIYLFYLGFPVQLLLAILLHPLFTITLIISFFSKLLFEYLILKKGIKTIFPHLQLRDFFITELLHIPYILIAGLSGAFGNYKWKDRKIKR